MFLPYYKEVYKLDNPGESERREYFRPLILNCTAELPKPKSAVEPVQELAVLPVSENRKLTARYISYLVIELAPFYSWGETYYLLIVWRYWQNFSRGSCDIISYNSFQGGKEIKA